VYFDYRSSLKPLGISTMMLKFPRFSYFILHDVLYLPDLQRNFLYIMQIPRKFNSIDLFDRKFEIRRSFDKMVIMIGWEDDILLKLQGTYAQTHNSSYLFHNDEGTLSYSLLWHAIFGKFNYDSIHMLNKNGVSGFLTIPRILKQCDTCILGKHSNKHFHDSTSRSCRNLELIQFDLCGPMPIAYNFGNNYIMNFIDDYTRMC